MGRSKPQEKIKRAIAPLRVKVKFLTDCDFSGGKPKFKKDSIRELVISSANHWVRRGKAVKYVEPPKKAKSVEPKPAKRVGRSKKADIKAESIVEETASEETPVNITLRNEGVITTENADDWLSKTIEGKKTEDGESFGGMDDLMD